MFKQNTTGLVVLLSILAILDALFVLRRFLHQLCRRHPIQVFVTDMGVLLKSERTAFECGRRVDAFVIGACGHAVCSVSFPPLCPSTGCLCRTHTVFGCCVLYRVTTAAERELLGKQTVAVPAPGLVVLPSPSGCIDRYIGCACVIPFRSIPFHCLSLTWLCCLPHI